MSSVCNISAWQLVPQLTVELYRQNKDELEKLGCEAPIMEKLAWPPEKAYGFLPDIPRPLIMSLLGGLTVAGAGYGAGEIAKHVLPERWRRNNLSRTLTYGGFGLGAMPGVLYGLSNLAAKRPYNADILRPGYKPPQSVLTKRPADPEQHKAAMDSFLKRAYNTGIGAFQPIPVDEFNRVIWQDPRVSRPLSPMLQAAATGVVTSAANLPGKTDTRLVTPMDMGRIAAGMGSGYLSGALVGATLGTLMGMPDDVQDKLKSTGMWAGIIANAVPIIFGGR